MSGHLVGVSVEASNTATQLSPKFRTKAVNVQGPQAGSQNACAAAKKRREVTDESCDDLRNAVSDFGFQV